MSAARARSDGLFLSGATDHSDEEFERALRVAIGKGHSPGSACSSRFFHVTEPDGYVEACQECMDEAASEGP